MGCGRTGSMLAAALVKRGHDVAVIDVDARAFRRLGEDFPGKTITGVGFDRQVLEAAGIRDADAFAAVSSGDNSNILAARVVHEVYDLDTVVARIYDQGRAAVYERLGIPTVAPVKWAVGQVLRRLLPDGSEPVWRDPSGNARLLQVHVHSGWVGKSVAEISKSAGVPVPFLRRVGRGIVPRPETVFQDGDLLYVACTSERVSDIESLFAVPPARR